MPVKGCKFEDEGVASAFSPRALSLPATEGCWPSDQLVSTPHKRVQNHHRDNESDKFSVNIPPSGPAFESHKPHFSSQKRHSNTHGLSRTAAGWRLPAVGSNESYSNSHSRDFVLNVSEFSGNKPFPGKSKLSKSSSIHRSPSASWNPKKLELYEEIKDHGLKKKNYKIICVACATFSIALLWFLCFVFDYSFPILFYLEPVILSWMEVLAILFLVMSFAVAAHIAFPELMLAAQLPTSFTQRVISFFRLKNVKMYLVSTLPKTIETGFALKRRKGSSDTGKTGLIRNSNTFHLFHRCLSSADQFFASSYETFYDLLPNRFTSRISGYAVQKYANGDFYEGEFYRGKYSGTGVFMYSMKGKYEGEWVNGNYDGYGVETWTKGSRYRGQYEEGLREGFGMYRFYNGDVYTGMWKKGQSHGFGLQICADGSRFRGQFAWGRRHGYGKYVFRNGDSYSGEYFNDAMHGYGVYEFANGHKYEGSWHEGRKQGLGLYAFRGGDMKAGIWHRGALLTRSTSTALTDTTSAVSHSKVLHAVQEARRAAKKAENVNNVDVKVEKAVNLAYKAAMAARVSAVKASSKGYFESKPERNKTLEHNPMDCYPHPHIPQIEHSNEKSNSSFAS